MSKITVTVAWGARPETPLELAERWLTSLGQLTELSAGALTAWRWDEDGDAPGQPVPTETESFAAAIETANPHDDADIIGRTAFVVGQQEDGGYARLRVTAGGTDGYTPFTAALALFSSDASVSAPLADRLPEALAVLARTWDADWGHAYDRKVFTEVKAAYGLRNSSPRCGWAVYLSARRATRVPGDLVARRVAAEHGGTVLDFAETPGSVPDTETVLAAHKALAEAGALEPLPIPMPGPKL